MAHVLQNTSASTNLISDQLHRLRNAMARRRIYNKVLSELSAMSDRELTDINLTRGDIRRVARDATEL